MSVKCTMCGKEMPAYPFDCATTCIKCSLQGNFQVLETKVISVKNREVVLAVER